MENSNSNNKIGIIVGGGSGRVLTRSFVKYAKSIAKSNGKEIKFYINSTKSVDDFNNTEEEIKKFEYPIFSTHKDFYEKIKNTPIYDERIEKETNDLLNLLGKWRDEGIKYIFRTSLNADVLYRLRAKAKAIKLITEEVNNNKIIVVRDMATGFYALKEVKPDKEKNPDIIEFKSEFIKKFFLELAKFSKEHARQYFKSDFETIFIFKHHLFNGYFEEWINESKALKEIKYSFLQPDTGAQEFITNLQFEKNKNFLLITGNEVGDIIHEYLLNITGGLSYEILLYTKNYYLGFNKIEVYQTVHGSADDKDGKVCPVATLRIAADMLSSLFKDESIKNITEEISQEWLREDLRKRMDIIDTLEEFKPKLSKAEYDPIQITNSFIEKFIKTNNYVS